MVGWIGKGLKDFDNKTEAAMEELWQFQDHAPVLPLQPIEGLPEVVKRWLKVSKALEHPPTQKLFLKQEGCMRLSPGQKGWYQADAWQGFTVNVPGFVWAVKMKMRGLPVLGMDRFFHGEGSMEIRLLGRWPLVNVAGQEKLNQSTAQRFLGEMIWFPSAALHPGVTWTALDENRAKGTLTVGQTQAEAIFHFNESGQVSHFVAQRYRDLRDVKTTPWIATIRGWKEDQGRILPYQVEASWLLEEGPFTWYVFEVSKLQYT